MATRVYLESSGAAAFDTLAFSAYWAAVNATHYHYASGTTKAGSTNARRDLSWSTGTRANIQYITGQWSAHDFTTSETIKLQVRANSDSGSGVYLAAAIRVISSDGGTVRGTLYQGAGPTVVPSSTISNRSLGSGGAAVSIQNNVSMSNGDRLAIELGHSSSGYSGSGLYVGSDSGTDLPEDETTQTAYNAWCEFSATLSAYSAGETVGGAGSISAVSSITGSAKSLRTGIGSSSSVSSVAGSGLRVRSSSGSSSSVSLVSGAAQSVRGGAGSSSSTSAVSGSGLRGRAGAGNSTATSSVSGSGLRTRTSGGAISSLSSVSGLARSLRSGAGQISVVSTITGSGIGLYSGKGSVSAISLLSAFPQAEIEGRGVVSAISAITGFPSALKTGAGTITSISVVTGISGTATVANKHIYVKTGGEWVEISPTASVVTDADGGTW